jgi:hypothetical protein
MKYNTQIPWGKGERLRDGENKRESHLEWLSFTPPAIAVLKVILSAAGVLTLTPSSLRHDASVQLHSRPTQMWQKC